MVENRYPFGFEETPLPRTEATKFEDNTQLDLHAANQELDDAATGHARAVAADMAQRVMHEENASHDKTPQQLQVENLLVVGQNIIKMRQLAQGIGIKASIGELRSDDSRHIEIPSGYEPAA